MFPKSVEYNDENFKMAIEQTRVFDANMGGTEIYKPLLDIFSKPLDPTLPRNIYLLTDGAVYDTASVVDLVKRHAQKARMHTYGIGSGVSIDLVKGCAKAGNGTCTFIEDSRDIENKVLSSL